MKKLFVIMLFTVISFCAVSQTWYLTVIDVRKVNTHIEGTVSGCFANWGMYRYSETSTGKDTVGYAYIKPYNVAPASGGRWVRMGIVATSTDYYTQAEMDSKLSTGYYSQTATDAKLSAGYYDKTATDTKINLLVPKYQGTVTEITLNSVADTIIGWAWDKNGHKHKLSISLTGVIYAPTVTP